MILLTNEPIDLAAVLQSVQSPAAGAIVLFLGSTREMTDGRRTRWLHYEAYAPLAEKLLAELASQARQRWPLVALSIVHRLGRVEIGEASVAIAVSSAHRQAAFEAGQWLIDRLKESVPIWKEEHWADGTSQWVHPGLSPPAVSGGAA